MKQILEEKQNGVKQYYQQTADFLKDFKKKWTILYIRSLKQKKKKMLKKLNQNLYSTLKKERDQYIDETDIQNVDTDDENAPSIEPAQNGLDPDEAVGAADEAPTDEPADGVGTIDPKLKSKLEAKGQMKEQSNTKDLSKVKINV